MSAEPKNKNKKFLQLLDESNVLIPKDLYDILTKQYGEGTLGFLEALIREEHMTKDLACRLWCDSLEISYTDPLATTVMPSTVKRLPRQIAEKAQAIPIYEIDEVLTVCMAEPLDKKMVGRLEKIIDQKISPVFSLPSEIKNAIEIHYSNEKSIKEYIAALEQTQGSLLPSLSPEEMTGVGESKSVIQIFETLLFYAIKERVSDIHIEPLEDDSRVRFRIDGQLRKILNFTKSMHKALNARIKVLCKVDISESRLPQDGRFEIPVGTSKVAFRVSFIPTADGEKVVIRILAPTDKKDSFSLDRILLSQTILNPFMRLIKSPNGIIFVTGPTGSGKTTTLYAVLNEINEESVNICTIEDPIELRLKGLMQSQTNTKIGLSFPLLFRSLLRQDPDMILVGEIRDLETAKIATEAALTGHLVFSTLHTNNAVQAIVRLVEMGIPSYMVAPSVLGVLAQRLAARICDKCKESYNPSEKLLSRYFHDSEGKKVHFYRGIGCINCGNSGYKGRVAFNELVLVSEEVRSLIRANANLSAIAGAAEKIGYKPLRYDGLKKVLQGLTTLEQIERLAAFELET